MVKDAKARGGRIACGGSGIDRPGYFFQPTIVADVAEGVELVDEEQFGNTTRHRPHVLLLLLLLLYMLVLLLFLPRRSAVWLNFLLPGD